MIAELQNLTGKENVVIEQGACSLTLLPHLGGKIASLRVHGIELLQAPLVPYAPRTRTMPFDAGDASGWDECLPSVAACTVATSAGPVQIPDHGDLWRVAWELSRNQEAEQPDSIILRGQCFSLPLELERTLALNATEKGWKIQLSYRLANTGDRKIPWAWSAHPSFAAQAGDRIILPDSIKTLRLEGGTGNRLGVAGDKISWPVAQLPDGGQADLRLVQPAESGFGDKLFAGPLAAGENWCILERPSAKVRIRVTFDPFATPYLGLWICAGGWPERPGAKQSCVALEPATAPVDSLAQTGPWSRKLAPGQSDYWPMTVEIESL